ESTATTFGGDDTITAGKGNDVVMWGLGRDENTVNGDGSSVVLSDSGHADFTVVGGQRMLTHIGTTSPDGIAGASHLAGGTGLTRGVGTSSNDTIRLLGNGNNVVLGGSGADQITMGDGNDVILGDNGQANYTAAGVLVMIESTATTYGGDDTITAGKGNDVV